MSQKGLTPILIVLLIALGLGGFFYYQKQAAFTAPQTTNQVSNSNEQSSSEIKKYINFTLPSGWKEEALVSSDYKNSNIVASFVSEDYAQDPIPQTINGAKLLVFRLQSNQSKSLREEIINRLPLPLRDKVGDIVPIIIGDIEGLNKFLAYEGSYDHNYILQDGHIWDFRFECAPGCETKTTMDVSKYARDRDLFLNSIKFLGQGQVKDETANPDSIGANWKTYTNAKYKFSFRYPAVWLAEESSDLGLGIVSEERRSGYRLILGDPNRRVSAGGDKTIIVGSLDIHIYNKKNDAFYKDNLNGYYIDASNVKSSVVNGLNVEEVHHKSCSSYDDCITVFFKKDGNIFSIDTAIWEDRYKNLDIIYKILATFKFLDQK